MIIYVYICNYIYIPCTSYSGVFFQNMHPMCFVQSGWQRNVFYVLLSAEAYSCDTLSSRLCMYNLSILSAGYPLVI